MKHLITFFIIGLLAVNISYSQAVDDRAVVPVSVTLNSILRLNVESGGNVEFNFNTLDQYQNGISGIGEDNQYKTKITIASSVDWKLNMGAEEDGLISTDDTSSGAGTMALHYITYNIVYEGTANNEDDWSFSTSSNNPEDLKTSENIITNAGSNAGDVNKNAFRIEWACGSTEDGAPENLMGSSLTGGRYSTNVFFILRPD